MISHRQLLRRSCRELCRGLGAIVCLGWLWLGSGPTGAAAPIPKEYQLKAGFLYNFTKFIEWPAPAPERAEQPVVFGVLGKNPFGGELQQVLTGRLKHGRTFEVRQISSVAQAQECDLVFVPRGQEGALGAEITALLRRGVLTVGESPEFASLGGLITFTTEQNKIRFQINQTVAGAEQFKISPELLKLASSVRLPGGERTQP